MRFLKSSLLLLFLFNTGFPCTDTYHVVGEDLSATNIAADAATADSEDLCSPLCVCECCAAKPTIESKQTLHYYPVELPFIALLKNNNTKSVISLIYQPPRH